MPSLIIENPIFQDPHVPNRLSVCVLPMRLPEAAASAPALSSTSIYHDRHSLFPWRGCTQLFPPVARYRAPCLLCAEPTADQCHRRLVAEYVAAHVHELTVIHS